MRLASDIHTTSETLLVAKGQSTTQTIRQHLLNCQEKGLIEAKVDVWHKTEVVNASHK